MGTNYPFIATLTHSESNENNPFNCGLEDYQELCNIGEGKSNKIFNYTWKRDLKQAYSNVEKACRAIIKRRDQEKQELIYGELVLLSILEILSSIIYFHDHPEFQTTPQSHERLSIVGTPTIPLSQWTRNLYYAINIEFCYPKLKWIFNIRFVRKCQVVTYNTEESLARLFVRASDQKVYVTFSEEEENKAYKIYAKMSNGDLYFWRPFSFLQ